MKEYSEQFLKRMCQRDTTVLIEEETVDEEAMRERLMSWADAVSKESTMDYELSMDALKTFFDEIC